MFKRVLIITAFASLSFASVKTRATSVDTRLLAQPAVSATHVAFVYAGDLWSAAISGADVRRLTTSQGEISGPAFSPDGRSVAFSAEYEGNTDVLRRAG
jgi:tricorn protease